MLGSYLLLFSVKAKAYSEKFQQTIAKILPLNVSFFSLRNFLSQKYIYWSWEEALGLHFD